MEMVKSVLKALSGTASNIIIYIAIVAMFVVGIVYCILPVVRTRGQLRRAARTIRAGSKAKRSWQEDSFLGRGSLMAHWSAYLNNLFFADGEYHNPSNVEDFINEETVIYGPGRSAFADALPTLLVSLGFLGTLIGLAQGLSGFDMTDSDAAMASIMTLIPGMKTAFMTSIFGVVGSVLFTLITRMIYGSTEHALRSFYGAMSRYAGVLSVDPLTQVAIYQQEQTALIQTMAKDLNGKFTENIATAIENAIEPVNQNIKTFMTVTSQDQMRFLDAVVMRFVDRMDETLDGRLQDFGRTLDSVNRTTQDALGAVRDGVDEAADSVRDLKSVQRIAREMVENLSGYLDELRRNARAADESYRQVGDTIAQMDALEKQQTAYLKTVSAMQADVSRSVDAMTRAVSEFTRRFSEQNAQAARVLDSATDALSKAGADMADAQRAANKAFQDELADTMDAYRDYVNQFTQRVDYLAASISDSLSGMPRAVTETSNLFLDEVDRLSQALSDGRNALSDAVDRLYAR